MLFLGRVTIWWVLRGSIWGGVAGVAARCVSKSCKIEIDWLVETCVSMVFGFVIGDKASDIALVVGVSSGEESKPRGWAVDGGESGKVNKGEKGRYQVEVDITIDGELVEERF